MPNPFLSQMRKMSSKIGDLPKVTPLVSGETDWNFPLRTGSFLFESGLGLP